MGDEDRRNGVLTLSSLMGKRVSFWFYAMLVVAPYGFVLGHAWSSSLSTALPLLTAPIGAQLVADFRRGNLQLMPMRTAKFQFMFGMLLVGGMLIPLPPLISVLHALGDL